MLTTIERKVIRTAKRTLSRIRKEELRLEKILDLYDESQKEHEEQHRSGVRFHSHDLIPVLKLMKGEFTLDDLTVKCQGLGILGSRLQIYSALNTYKGNMVKVVSAGFGQSKAIYRVDQRVIKSL